MSEESNDVTKALAAFGAPSIRYHSFGQAQIRPSGLNPMRRPVAAPVAPTAGIDPVLVQQAEPVAAPEPAPMSHLIPQPVIPPQVAPRPAPFLGEPAPARSTPLFTSSSTVAPPPRPLAEWAAPVSSTPIRSQAAPVVSTPEQTYVPAPPPPTPVMAPHLASPTVAAAPPAYAPAPSPAPLMRSAMPSVMSSLPEIFDYLAAS